MGFCIAKWRYRNQPSDDLAMCIWLNQLSWPNKIHDMPHLFGVGPSYISAVFNDIMRHFRSQFIPLMRFDRRRLTIEKMREYAEAVGEDGKI